MNQLKPFMYGPQEVRTVTIENQPWFAAKDICEVLELTNATVSIQRLDDDEVTKLNLGGLNGETNFVNEPGLYSLILGSRKPEAKQFKRWITHEVIPSIRKTGSYNAEQFKIPTTLTGALRLAADIEDKRLMLEQKIEADRPKTLFAEAVATSQDCILIGQLATMLKQNGVNIGQTRLFNYLREEGYLCKSGDRRNLPTQRSMELRLFEVKEFTVHGNTGIRVKTTPKVTGRGQVYFINKFLTTAS